MARSAPSASRTTRRRSWARSSISSCPETGHVFNANEEFGTVESVKAVSELYTPISGEVVEVNKGAIAEPGIVNDDPFGDGWLLRIKLSTDQEVSTLMSAEQYAEYVRTEEK
jgi:glycine cleavage system H protein